MRNGIDCRGRKWEETSMSSRMKDASGQRFDRLVAMFPVVCKEKKQWLCKCDCGNELVVTYTSLKSGNTRSCGCLNKDALKDMWNEYRENNDPTGQTFGELTAVKFVRSDRGQSIYLFKCSCGKYVELPIKRVRYGNTSSCGHIWTDWNDSTKSDIIGQRFGKLVVKSYAGVDSHGATTFKCLCDCGNTTIVARYSLVDNRTHSCGCICSVGESNIQNILDGSHVRYKHQYCFTDLVSDAGGHLLYDFGILNDNMQVERLIEFDGEQHFKAVDIFGGEERFATQQKNDRLKNQYALSHNIPLVRIPYYKRDSMSIEDLFGNEYLVKEEV